MAYQRSSVHVYGDVWVEGFITVGQEAQGKAEVRLAIIFKASPNW